MQIDTALILREILKYFREGASNYFESIKNYLLPEAKKIIQTDYIHFCANDVSEKRNFIEELLSENEKQKIDIDSLFVLSVVADPNCLDSESMHNLLESFLVDSNEFDDDEEKRLTVCILLQVFTNYSSLFDFSDCFWNMFDSKPNLIPNYVLEYYILSLFSFVTTFGDSIPNEKLDDVVSVIQKLIGLHLYDYLEEKMKFLLENCFTQNQ